MTESGSSLDPLTAVRICDEFEASWSAKTGTSFRPYLRQVEKPQRAELFRLLMTIEIERRNAVGQQVDPNDYWKYGEDTYQLVRELVDTGPMWHDATEAHQPKSGAVPGHFKGQKIGVYKLVRQIGEGGMGSVWLAEQSKPVRRKVALKLIRADAGSKSVLARFDAERQALAMMEHPNIAKILDVGTTDSGAPYFVMELVKGLPINQYCDKHKLSIQERLNLMVSVCRAVQHAHQKGIIHRDLKPSNILVQQEDGKPTPKVIDFGLAKALDQSNQLTDKTLLTEMGNVVGTVQYMSPEQAALDAAGADARSDIYSLGVVLYELLVGSTPIDRATVKQNPLLKVLKLIREKEPPRPSERLNQSQDRQSILTNRQIQLPIFQQALKSELDWVVIKALEIDPNQRYESAYQLARQLRAYIRGEAIEVRPPSLIYQFKKLVRKNRITFGLVTAATFLILLLLFITSNLALRTTEFRLASEAAANDKIAAEQAKAIAVKEKNSAVSRLKHLEVLQQAAEAFDRAQARQDEIDSKRPQWPKELQRQNTMRDELAKIKIELNELQSKFSSTTMKDLLDHLIGQLAGASDTEIERLANILESLPKDDLSKAFQKTGIDLAKLEKGEMLASIISTAVEFKNVSEEAGKIDGYDVLSGTWTIVDSANPGAEKDKGAISEFDEMLVTIKDNKRPVSLDIKLTGAKKELNFSTRYSNTKWVVLSDPKSEAFMLLTRFGNQLHAKLSFQKDLESALLPRRYKFKRNAAKYFTGADGTITGVKTDEARMEFCDEIISSRGYNPFVLFSNGRAYRGYNLETGEFRDNAPKYLSLSELSQSGNYGLGRDPSISANVWIHDVKTEKQIAAISSKGKQISSGFLNDSNTYVQTLDRSEYKLSIFNLPDGKSKREFSGKLLLDVSVDGRLIAMMDPKAREAIEFLDTNTFKTTFSYDLPAHKNAIDSPNDIRCRFSPDGKKILIYIGIKKPRFIVYDLQAKKDFGRFSYDSKQTSLERLKNDPLHLTNAGVVIVGHHTAIDPLNGNVLWRATQWIGKKVIPKYIKVAGDNQLVFIYPEEEKLDRFDKLETTKFMTKVTVNLPAVGSRFADTIRLKPEHLLFDLPIYDKYSVGRLPISWKRSTPQSKLANDFGTESRKAIEDLEKFRIDASEFKAKILESSQKLLESMDEDQRLRLWAALTCQSHIPQDLDRMISVKRPELMLPTIPWTLPSSTPIQFPTGFPSKDLKIPTGYYGYGSIHIPQEPDIPIAFSKDQTVTLWNGVDKFPSMQVVDNFTGGEQILISDNGRYAAIFGTQNCSIYDLSNGQRKRIISKTVQKTNYPSKPIAIKNDTLFFINYRRLCRWDFINKLQPVPQDSIELPNLWQNEEDFTLSPDGKHVVTYGRPRGFEGSPFVVFLQEADTGKITGRTAVPGPIQWSTGLKPIFSPNGEKLAMLFAGPGTKPLVGRLVLFDTKTGEITLDLPLPEFFTPGPIENRFKRQILWSADGKHCLVGLKLLVNVETKEIVYSVPIPAELDQVSLILGVGLVHAWLTKSKALVLVYRIFEKDGFVNKTYLKTKVIKLPAK